MHITCPKGCHKKEDWTYVLAVLNEYEAGEFCDTPVDRKSTSLTPEAEKDRRKYVLKFYMKCVLAGAAVAALASLLGLHI